MRYDINLEYYNIEELEELFEERPARAPHPKQVTAEKKAKKEAYAALKAENRQEEQNRKALRKLKRS